MGGKSKDRQQKKATMTIKARRAAKRAKSGEMDTATTRRKSGSAGD